MTPIADDTRNHPGAPAGAPRWLLWSASSVALALALTAFLLWGLNGPAYLLDMVIALCT